MLADDKSLNFWAERLSVVRVNTVVTNKWISHRHDLSLVRRVCEYFLIARHARVEYDLSGPLPDRAEGLSLEDGTVFESYSCSPGVSTRHWRSPLLRLKRLVPIAEYTNAKTGPSGLLFSHRKSARATDSDTCSDPVVDVTLGPCQPWSKGWPLPHKARRESSLSTMRVHRIGRYSSSSYLLTWIR